MHQCCLLKERVQILHRMSCKAFILLSTYIQHNYTTRASGYHVNRCAKQNIHQQDECSDLNTRGHGHRADIFLKDFSYFGITCVIMIWFKWRSQL